YTKTITLCKPFYVSSHTKAEDKKIVYELTN
ncbi:unnamed protein product, partial [marine sediment metagenome]